MSSIASPTIVSRPKVHRPPFLDVDASVKTSAVVRRDRRPLGRSLRLAGILALVMISIVLFEKHSVNVADSGSVRIVTLPAILVGSQAASDEGSLIGDAQASVVSPNKSNGIISLRHNSEYIVGQLTKIPVENEQITEIKPANDIDNHAGRELLSIISKY